MSIVTQLRWAFARRPLLWWLLIGAFAAIAAVVALNSIEAVDATRRSWGTTTPVWISVADTPIGTPLRTEQRDYPLTMVPSGALRSAPGDVTARHHLGVGEIVVADDVTPNGIAGLMPAGSVAIGVPVRQSPHLTVGAAVVAYANGTRLASGIVIAVDEEQVIIAVPQDDAASLSVAVPGGAVIVGMVP